MPEEASLARAVAALRAAAPELDGTALADALWLASRMAEDGQAKAVSGAPSPEQSAEAACAPEPMAEAAATPPSGAGAAAPERALHERLAGASSRIRGDAVAASRAAGLPLALEVTRALRPWKRPWRQGRRPALDIDATVDGYARSGELIPAFSPAPERWFDLVLVVDRSPAMQVWQETIADFTAVLDRLGAFRTLQVRDLTFGDEGPELRDHQGRLTGTGQLRSPDGRRLVVAVSDCAAPGWREPNVWRQLWEWSLTTPVALLNPLPPKLWRRTGLDLPTVRVAPGAPGSVNSHLIFDPPPLLPDGDDGPWLPIPVLSLSPHSLDRWSRTLMRTAPEGCGAVLVPPGGRTATRRRASRPSAADARADGFLRTASPAAARLAVLCSAFDRLSMRLLHLIRQELVLEATTADVAELLTSGLFSLGTDTAGTVELALPEKVQRRLRRELAEHEVWRINRALSRHVSSRGAGAGQLPSVAHDPEGTSELPAELQPFGQASRRTLELLGLSSEGREPRRAGSGRPVPTQLPSETVEFFVGRERPLEELLRFLTSPGSRVVCLAARGGTAGAGKTALALRAAHMAKNHFPDGQLFVDLRGSSSRPLDPAPVLVGFLQALGVPLESVPGTIDELVELYRETLAGRRVLLVLDNAHDASQVAPLLAGTDSAGCAVVITSRQAMPRLRSNVIQIAPLDETHGLTLLSLLTGRRGLSSAERLELVRGCGGWPLAIALIAKWIATRETPPTHRIALGLKSTDPTDTALDAALKLRFNHLDSGLARALMQLALMDTAQLTVHEIAAVLDMPLRSAVETVNALVLHGLLERSALPARYPYQFHDEVQRFARQRAWGESDAVERLLSHYSREAVRACRADRPGDLLADRLGLIGSDEATVARGTGLERLLEELPHVLTVLSADDVGRSVAPRIRANLLLLLRDLASSPFHAAQYRSAALTISDDAMTAGDGLSRARAQVALAHSLFSAGLMSEARAALETTVGEEDPATAGIVAHLFGTIAQLEGGYSRALDHYTRARAIAGSCRDHSAEASALESLARLHLEHGAADHAVDAATRGLELLRALGISLRVAELLRVLSDAHHQLGHHTEVLEYLSEAVPLFREHRSHQAVGMALLRMAQTHLAVGDLESAHGAAQASALTLVQTGSTSQEAEALTVLGNVLHHVGDTDTARQRWREALALLLTTDDSGRVAELQELLAEQAEQAEQAEPPRVALQEQPRPTVIAVDIQDFATHRSADRPVLLDTLDEVLAAVGVDASRRRPRFWDGTVVLAVDADVPIAHILTGLVDDLPRALDTVNQRRGSPQLAVRVAVHAGAVQSGVSGLAVDTALKLLRCDDLDSVARASRASRTVCVSAIVMEAALRHPGTTVSTERFAKLRINDESGTLKAWLQIPDIRPPMDEELQRLREALLAEDPDGRRMANLLRDRIDKALDGPRTGRFDVEELTSSEHGHLSESVELAVREEFDLPDVQFDVHFTLYGPQGLFLPEAQAGLCLALYANEMKSTWWAGLIRAEPGLPAEAVDDQDGKRALDRDAAPHVEWLHRRAELPENLLLHVPEADRTAILSMPTGTTRAYELFRRVTGRRITTATLRTVTGLRDVSRRVREARRLLDSEGLVILSHLPDDRELCRELGLPVAEAGEWVSVRRP
ncbi:NaeI family type II restriction endonuclease [Streptomyces sp. NPDC002730]|uniref:NaeI family type II restriction endonuclease n=1 Tax=Streptomyces sp. NPDC002730 TaxID=3364662 RepID=UPI0036C7AAEE